MEMVLVLRKVERASGVYEDGALVVKSPESPDGTNREVIWCPEREDNLKEGDIVLRGAYISYHESSGDDTILRKESVSVVYEGEDPSKLPEV